MLLPVGRTCFKSTSAAPTTSATPRHIFNHHALARPPFHHQAPPRFRHGERLQLLPTDFTNDSLISPQNSVIGSPNFCDLFP
jgi:hypothetical protein